MNWLFGRKRRVRWKDSTTQSMESWIQGSWCRPTLGPGLKGRVHKDLVYNAHHVPRNINGIYTIILPYNPMLEVTNAIFKTSWARGKLSRGKERCSNSNLYCTQLNSLFFPFVCHH
ncbi:hypothetical protein O181_038233 [Austropuccinia psidii MF-1]|uniref:Uncharacterized protein n=1 Tax=Austropuccinia psidii MF-1 TaxID=1389203 RepID=A0A9Q3HAU6_9BASI|nr:hypothetical protein [Austropuccinia psidii MF-1]